jgi:hypothetical protein
MEFLGGWVAVEKVLENPKGRFLLCAAHDVLNVALAETTRQHAVERCVFVNPD